MRWRGRRERRRINRGIEEALARLVARDEVEITPGTENDRWPEFRLTEKGHQRIADVAMMRTMSQP